MVKRGENADDNGENGTSGGQAKIFNGKTDAGIRLSSVELVFVSGDSIGNGQW